MLTGTMQEVLAALTSLGWVRKSGYNPDVNTEVVDSPLRSGAQYRETYALNVTTGGIMATRGEQQDGQFKSYNSPSPLENVLPMYGQTEAMVQEKIAASQDVSAGVAAQATTLKVVTAKVADAKKTLDTKVTELKTGTKLEKTDNTVLIASAAAVLVAGAGGFIYVYDKMNKQQPKKPKNNTRVM